MSNYPPGAANDPRAPYNEDVRDTHDHEWSIDAPTVDRDEYVYIYHPCNSAEVTGSVYDSERDEVYYRRKCTCDARRETIYEPDWDSFPVSYDKDPQTHEEIYEAAAMELTAEIPWDEPDEEAFVWVTHGVNRHRIRFVLDSVTVLE